MLTNVLKQSYYSFTYLLSYCFELLIWRQERKALIFLSSLALAKVCCVLSYFSCTSLTNKLKPR